MLQDFRYALRTLRHNPGFALVAILSLALGIGANSAIFSFADFLLLPHLPVPNPSAIVAVQSQFRGESLGGLTDYSYVSYRDFDDLRTKSTSFAGLSAWQFFQFGFTADKTAQPQMRFGALVSGNFFDMLDLRPELGRGFRPDEDKVQGRDAVVILGHSLWETEFASRPDVIGTTVMLNGFPFTVIGVAPKSFIGPNKYMRNDLYVPLAMQPALAAESPVNMLEDRSVRALMVLGRLKPGVSIRQAAAEARVIGEQLSQTYPKTNHTCSLVVRTYRDSQLVSMVFMMAFILSALAAVVLLIACANVMNLMLNRAAARKREIAVRLAIGAGRGRLVRQLLTESLVIALLGGALGLVVAQTGADLFSRIRVPVDVPLVMDVNLNPEVLLFTLLVSMASAVLFGLAPALQSTRPDLVPALKSGSGGEGKRRRLLGRNTLVIVQVAGSLILLVFAAQAYGGMSVLLSSPAGFRTDHILMASFDPSLARDSADQTKGFYKQLLDQARTLPGVKSAALTHAMPMVPTSNVTRVIPEGIQLPAGTEAISVFSNVVTERYFDTLGVPLLEGRDFQVTDREDSPRVMIVNEHFARKYYPNGSAIGKHIRLNGPDGPFAQIIGVAKQSKYVFPIETPMDYLYVPLAQNPATSMTLTLETQLPSAELVEPLRSLVRSLDPRQPIYSVRTMEEFFDVRARQTLGLISEVIAGLGVLGLILALVGIYGLMAYSVSLRSREIGIRMALGSNQANVITMVLKQGMTLAGIGVAIGLLSCLGVSKPTAAVVNSQGFNWALVALVTLALLLMTAVAAYIPARYASRVDPNVVLRQE